MSDWVVSEVRACFSDGQRSFASHKRAVQRLSAAFQKDRKLFWREWIRCLNRVLIIYQRTPAAERLVHLVASFAVGHSNSTTSREKSRGQENLCSALLAFLLERSSASSKAVRFRSCQIISAILTSLPEFAEINEHLFDPLVEKLLARSNDKVPKVRMATISGLGRLQDEAEDINDPVTARLIVMMTTDSSPLVRKAALSFTMVSGSTATAFVSRCSDVREDVRKTALRILAHRVHPRSIPIAARVEILRTGLQDRSQSVRKVCGEVLLKEGWLDGACERDLIELIGFLDPETYEKEARQAADVLLSQSEELLMSTTEKLNVDELSPESAVVLRACALKSSSSAEILFSSPTEYARILKHYENSGFIRKQLLDVSQAVDLADESGRRVLQVLLKEEILKEKILEEDLLKSAVRLLYKVSSFEEVEDFITSKASGVDLRSGNTMDEEMDSEDEDELPAHIEEKLTVMRLMESLLLLKGDVTDVETVQSTVLSGFVNSEPLLRAISLRCLSLLCLRHQTEEEVLRYLPLYIQVCGNDTHELQTIALQSMADFLMVFNLNEKATIEQVGIAEDQSEDSVSEEGDVSARTLVLRMLVETLLHSDGEMRSYAAEAAAKLLYCGRVKVEPELLSKLILLFFNPVTEEDNRLRQCLSVFFRVFALSSQANQAVFEDISMLALKMIVSAPRESPLASIDPVDMALFIFYLLGADAGTAAAQSSVEYRQSVIERIVLRLLNHVIDLCEDSGDSDELHAFCCVLGGVKLRLDVGKWAEMEQMKVLTSRAVGYVMPIADRASIYHLRRFAEQLRDCDRADATCRQVLFNESESEESIAGNDGYETSSSADKENSDDDKENSEANETCNPSDAVSEEETEDSTKPAQQRKVNVPKSAKNNVVSPHRRSNRLRLRQRNRQQQDL